MNTRNEQIKRMYHSGVTGKELSALFGLDVSTLSRIAGPRKARVRKMTPRILETAHRLNRFHNMRFKHHMSLKEIANIEGVKRQRVEQILVLTGGTGGHAIRIPYYYTFQNDEWLQKHAHMTNSELGEMFNMSAKKVQSLRAGTRYLPEFSKGQKGFFWENEIIKLINKNGLVAEGMSLKHPFDILINNIVRTDVKSCQTAWLPPRARNPYLRFRIGSKKRACDIFICVDARDQDSPVYFVIPSTEIKGNPYFLYIPTAKENGYYRFKDRWDLLTAIPMAVVKETHGLHVLEELVKGKGVKAEKV